MFRQSYIPIVLGFFSNFNIDNIRKVDCRSESRLLMSSTTTQIFSPPQLKLGVHALNI